MMQTAYHQSQRRMWFWLLLSLLLHLLLTLLFIDIDLPRILPSQIIESITQQQQLSQAAQPLDQTPQQTQLEEDEVRAFPNIQESSHFGAPVIFQDSPDLPASLDEKPEEKVEAEALDKQTIEESIAIPQEEVTTETDQGTADGVDEQPVHEQLPIMPEILPTQPALEAIAQDLSQFRHEEINQQPIKKRKKRRKKRTTINSEFSPANLKGMTLATFAKGFLECAKVYKNETVDLRTADLKYSGYTQRIMWYMQNASHLYSPTITLPYALHTRIILHLEINEDGRLLNAYLGPSSGAQNFDDAVLKSVQAASPFPPLPKHFNRKVFKTSLGVLVNLPSGTFKVPPIVALG